MADRPLRPAIHRCLGEPLPHQQANRTQAHPQVPEGFDSVDMRHRNNMRYCTPFPVLIPRLRAGCLRDTHPFAMLIGPTEVNPLAFDLHVLSVPLAFVLSQDQTLRGHNLFLLFYFYG